MRPISTAPKDGTPFIAYCPHGVERDGYDRAQPTAIRTFCIAWWGHPFHNGGISAKNPEGQWISADITSEVFAGSEWTGSWQEYEWVRVEPTLWCPLPSPASDEEQ